MKDHKKDKPEEHNKCEKDDSNRVKTEILSLLGLDKECEDPEKKAVLERLLEARMDWLMDKLSDFHMILWRTYLGVIAEFSSITADYTNDYVQKIVKLIYDDYCELILSRGMMDAFTNKVCMVGMMTLPLGGETSMCQRLNNEYGEQAINFVVQALTYFSGRDPEDEVWEKMIMSSLGSINVGTLS